MKSKIFLGLQILLGLIYFIPGGLNGLFQFIPPPDNLPIEAMQFFTAMMGTGYLYILLKATELIFGFFLLINIYVKLSLIVLAPITINIFLFLLFVDPSSAPMGVLMLVLHLAVTYRYWDSFKNLLSRK